MNRPIERDGALAQPRPAQRRWAIAANAPSLLSDSDEEALGCARHQACCLGCIGG